jgi:heme exporter protein D
VSWNGWDDFIAMGGYGFYVWGSYLVTLGLLAVELVLLGLRKRKAIAQARGSAS